MITSPRDQLTYLCTDRPLIFIPLDTLPISIHPEISPDMNIRR
jgi:hypothetical protein